jgi:hypothetical protein
MRRQEKVAASTGAPGHRRSQHLVESEAYRRIMSGDVSETLTDFAQQLSDWFAVTFPHAPPMTGSSIENEIREIWHRRHELIRGG